MTTASTQEVPRDPGLRVLGRTVGVAGLAGLGTVLAGLAIAGSAGFSGAFVGVAITVAAMVFGTFSVHVVAGSMPGASLLVALLTYVLQILMITVALAALHSSAAWGTTLAPGWVVAGVVVATIAWMAGHVWHSTRARIPAYDLRRPSAVTRGEAGAR